MSQESFKIVIVGAGLAGFAAAIALRGEGREITVLEQSRMKSEIGAAIHLAPNATKILNKYGLDVQKAANATICRQISEIDGLSGAVRMKVPIDTVKAFGAPWLFNHRVDLHNALRDYALKEDLPGAPAKVVTSAKVVSVDCENGVVKTEEGQEYKGDLVIGADGIHSVVRQAVIGSETIAQPSGHSAYRALIPKSKVENIPEITDILSVEHSKMLMVVDKDRRVILYPCRGATILNIVAICPDTLMREESTQSWNVEGSVSDMVQTYAQFPQWLKDTLSQAESCGLWQLRDQEPLSSWVKGRAIIIGDAAHAMLPHQGQGCGQSVEDAEAIQAFFEGVNHSLSTGEVTKRLQEVFKSRIDRSSTIQLFSRQQAMPPVDGQGGIALNAQQFVGYNFGYNGAKDWVQRQLAATGGVPQAV